MMELADILDDISFRSSKTSQLAALQRLHAILADVCVRPNEPTQRTRFLALQNDFETNIVSRILSSNIISASAAPRAVDELRAKASTSSTTVELISLTLSVLQGMALIHPRSKAYMGRRHGIQTLLDLLTALRHASTNPDDPDATIVSGIDTPDTGLATSLSPLACSVIDTLLCLLVDSPVALRVFEECNGLEVIVRTLKKVTGQHVRMKCLEFLYFYLQDEEVLAVTGAPAIDLPITSGNPKSSRTTTKPSTPASPAVLQTPRRPKTQQIPATDVRPRTRAPLERTVSGDSTHSMMSSCSDASGRPPFTRDRSVSRSSVASTASNVTDMSTKSGVKTSPPDPERRFHRTSVMPSLSYSSSTVSSTSTNQALDQPQQSDAFLQVATPSQTRPTTPNSLTQECLVPLPESPVKPGGLDTPKPKRRTKTEETPSSRVRERERGQDTPRAKTRSRDQPLQGANLFPSSGTSTPPSSNSPFGNPSSKPNDALKPKPALNLSLLTGEIDYEPVSPQKRKPSRTVGEDKQQPDTPSKESSNPFRSPSANPFQSPAPDPAKPAKHRPRQSEILPRPTPIRPGPRIVSTPPTTTPTTPIGTAPSTPTHGSGAASPTVAGATTPPVAGTATPPASTPAAETPGRKKKAAIPGGTRIPGAARGEGSGDLRKSVVGAAVAGVVKPQPSTEGLRKSQASSEALRKSQPSSGELRRSQYASSEALKKAQASPEGPRKDVLRKSLASSPDLRRDKVKKSAPSTPIVARHVRVKTEEGRSSGEGSRPSFESDKRISFEEPLASSSPARPMDKKMVRSSAEKKELLGAWLGNVDALVEGVQRAGVWGLR